MKLLRIAFPKRIKIEFGTDLEDNEYSQGEKQLNEADAKREIVDRVLSEIGTVNQLAEQMPKVPARSPRSGAGYIASELDCLGWKFCYVGKFVIGTLDAIFGRKDALTNFKLTNSQSVTHKYSDKKPATYAFTTTYRPKSNGRGR